MTPGIYRWRAEFLANEWKRSWKRGMALSPRIRSSSITSATGKETLTEFATGFLIAVLSPKMPNDLRVSRRAFRRSAPAAGWGLAHWRLHPAFLTGGRPQASRQQQDSENKNRQDARKADD